MRRTAAVALALTSAVATAGCGMGRDDDRATAPREGAGPTLPFPPRAAEPVTSRGHAEAPAGTVMKLGGRPEGIAYESLTGTLGVALDDRAHTFALIDPGTMKVRGSVPLPSGARHVTAAERRFLVPLEDADQLAQVPGNARAEPVMTKVGDGPHDAVASGEVVFVGDEFGGTVTEVRDGRAVRDVEVDVQPGGLADVGRGRVAVISVRANTIALLNARTLELGGSQNAGYGPSHVVAAPSDGRAFVADTRGGAILEYATRPRLKAVSRLAVGTSPYGLALDASHDRLWVTDTAADRLYEIDIRRSPKIVRTYPTVRQPNTVAVDPGRNAVFVLGQAQGELQRITPGTG